MAVETKETNPKDAIGVKKWRQFSAVPMSVVWRIGVAMLEGARKYGRHNYRAVGVRGSVYFDAALGHLTCWWEGEDIDEESGLHHIDKALASLVVIRDSILKGNWVDDRPPALDISSNRDELQKAVDGIFKKIPTCVEPYTEKGKRKK